MGVHIADVTHYVHPDTILDREAQQRATSVYLVDRVVPMLPEHLSNGICSLRPDEDKLTFSCIFEMDDKAKVHDARICRTVTRSNRRFTYEEAQEIIETGHGDYADEILKLNELAKTLRADRYTDGSVEFDRAEVRFEIDEKGHPVSVFFKESKDANKLIEEFMLLANKTVATFVGRPEGKHKPKAFVYRVHDMPDPGKLSDLSKIARNFGFKVKESGSSREVNKSINRMLADVKGRGEENFLSTLAIRSMAKAVYTTQNIGHYGLGLRLLHPLHLAHTPLPRHDGPPSARPLSLGRPQRQCAEARRSVQALKRYGAACCQRRARLHQVQAGGIYGRPSRRGI